VIVNKDILRLTIVVKYVIKNVQIVVGMLLIVFNVLQEDQDHHVNVTLVHMN